MQNRFFVVSTVLNEGGDTVHGRAEFGVGLNDLIRHVLHGLLQKRRDSFKMIVKRVAVDVAPVNDVFDGDFVQRALC